MDKKLEKQAKEILRAAEEKGVQNNFLFVTTFKRYLFLLDILADLENAIKSAGTLVEKQYVKDHKNLYSNPAIAEYNRTVDTANKTVSTLMRIIRSFAEEDSTASDEDPLMRMINGGNDEADEGV